MTIIASMIQESLPYLMETEVDTLKGRRLEAGDFHSFVTKDPVRTLLRWMGDPVKTRTELERSGAEWNSFCAVCRDDFGFNPEKDGAITAAEKLSSGKASWQLAWRRFKEAPGSYPGVKNLLESMPPQQLFMFEGPGEYKLNEYSPKSNRLEEERLERDLCALSSASQKDALAKIRSLADEHASRASWVWATLGESPLAIAIRHLRNLVKTIETSGNPNHMGGIGRILRDSRVESRLERVGSPERSKVQCCRQGSDRCCSGCLSSMA
ncbi:MAG: hypothetical protein U5R49_09250 [Deltaproteobacteria bacterium]|nr:hypothetical protein [Deltaproteobacteria bacterium]